MINNFFTLYGLSKCEDIVDEIVKDLKCEDYYFDLRLILTESITNAFEHGNNGEESKPIYCKYEYIKQTKYIKIEIKCLENDLEDIVIVDEITDDMLENPSGRGLYLIKCVSDEVYFKGNSMIIEKSLV